MRILLVEDNRDILANLADYLGLKGYTVDCAQDGLSGLHLAATEHYDLIVLDIMLPGIDGYTLCKRLREDARRDTPVIMLTARDTLDDKLAGLDNGADDYLTKPFAAQELDARLRAVMRRNRKELGQQVLTVGDLVFDPASHRVTRAGQELMVSPIGTKLLHILMRESPRVVTRRDIEGEIWGTSLPDSDTLRSHLYNLRKVIDKGFDTPLLHTVQSAGYRMADLARPVQKAAAAQPAASADPIAA